MTDILERAKRCGASIGDGAYFSRSELESFLASEKRELEEAAQKGINRVEDQKQRLSEKLLASESVINEKNAAIVALHDEGIIQRAELEAAEDIYKEDGVK